MLDGGRLATTFDGKTVVEFQPSEKTLPEDIVASLYRYLKFQIKVHPVMVQRMRESGKIPADLGFTYFKGTAEVDESWRLISLTKKTTTYPLPQSSVPDISILLAVTIPDFRTLLSPNVRKVIGGDYPPVPTPEELSAKFNEYFEQGALAGAGLTIIEHQLQYGDPCRINPPFCQRLRERMPVLQGDPAFRNYTIGHRIETKNRAQAIKLWESLDVPAGQRGYMIDLALANAYSRVFQQLMMQPVKPGVTDAAFDRANAHFQTALNNNPLVPNFYNDIGRLYFAAFLPTEAWIVWDLGRTLPKQFQPGFIQNVDKLEGRLESSFPGYFN